MAAEQVKSKRSYRKRRGDPGDPRSHKRSDRGDGGPTSKSIPAAERPADIDALRKARLAYLDKSPEEKRKEMKYEYLKRTRTVSLVDADKERRHGTTQDRDRASKGLKSSSRTSIRRPQHKRRPVLQRDDSEGEYVYQNPERAPVDKRAEPQTQTSKHKSRVSESTSRKADVRPQVPERRHTEPTRRQRADDEEGEPKPEDKPEPQPRREPLPVHKVERPSMKRSATTTRSKTEPGSTKPAQQTGASRKTPGLLSGLLLPKPTLQKKVSCLTCGADDIPISESARLPCTHRMCNSCLKRIFSMSVKDPAHMPPRCCTDQHIDLRHVDKLFDQKFKVLWNRKFEEYKTKNRIYCPARKCGAWIKPHYITIEHGRKVGRCKQCKTRVCATCSQKMHTSRDCPKDPATKAFVEVAKREGWRRCYNCSAMVELKEGCNHMTCRCTAEFCMVCGLKWKSCDCPWFNYQAVDAHLGDPFRYQEELDRRRDQVNRDEALARRLQQMGLMNAGGNLEAGALGLGNAANHHMNQNFIQQAREALTANYAQAGQAARDLLNGLVMGRENRLPGIPLQMDQMLETLGGGGGARPQGMGADPAEEGLGSDNARRAARRINVRRRNVVPEGAGGHRIDRVPNDNERRIRDWANSGPA
ncbi:hypothetical protein A1O1_00839 [Capronia coronata CBS 617.96]|uniref:RBR-type E3 ubiquitin transferase n=1 Tax=Capronia coronata CBS 617.96 TaxID=1182541 RepID=W9Z2B0_9EURO|nr:uncharacterized protein A1O1_00839 [Capronia coronata CBS 617.96]EXJ95716.1 hypothetical protein A1O1_00839 [Capronia coronata CBS 617.96]